MRGTVLEIIQQTAVELGLPVPNEAVASNGKNEKQLVGLLNSAGYELMYAPCGWQFLDRLGVVITVAGQDSYDLPDDFNRIINQTLWSSELELAPVRGPMSPQTWQNLKNGSLGSGPSQSFRIQDNKLVIDPVPGDDFNTYNFEYISDSWIQDSADPTKYKSRITNDGDIPLFDFYLLVKFLKVKMWQAKGLNTDALEKEFARVYDAVSGSDKGAPILSIVTSSATKLLSPGNVPEGNWRT